MLAKLSLILILASLFTSNATIIDFEVVGGVPDDSNLSTQQANGALMNKTLASLQSGDTFVIPNKTFHMMGGIIARDKDSITIQHDGTISFSDDMDKWPRTSNGDVLECFHFYDFTNFTLTSSGMGLFEGNGAIWWGIPGVGYLVRGENRPRMLNIENSKDVLVENVFFNQPPYWTVWIHGVDGLEIRNSGISAKRDSDDGHDIIDMTAFNTDGFDVSGKNIWVHDVTVWNQDDCVCVKDGSENVLVERVEASGVGLTIGSISGSQNRNITFRDSHMHNTYKGIYMKFRAGDNPGLIEDVLYENITIDNPEQWAIWIGPAQQSDSSNLCAAHPCSICWPTDPFAECNAPAAGSYRNVTLRDITVNNPKKSPGVIIGNSTNPIQGLVFDNVVINNPGSKPWGDDFYKCEGVDNGMAIGSTSPIPPCFNKAKKY